MESYILLYLADKKSEERTRYVWVFDIVYNLEFEYPETLWLLILAVLEKSSSDLIMMSLSAGPLEGLLAKHGEQFIERVELQARQEPKFRDLLGGVWKNTMTAAIWQCVETARLHKTW